MNQSFSTIVPQMQLVWDATSLTPAKTCARKYYYSIVLGRALPDENVHLIFGLHYHRGKELFYKAEAAGLSFDECIRSSVSQILRDSYNWNSPDPLKNRINLIRALIWSFEEYRNDPLQTLRRADGSAMVELTFKLATNITTSWGEQIFLAGHLDRVAGDHPTNPTDCWTLDYKSSRYQLNSDFFAKYTPDVQMTNYTIFGRLGLSLPIKGLMVEGCQLLTTSARFLRGEVPRKDDQLTEWLEDLVELISRYETYATTSRWPMNDAVCGLYGGCPFRPICSLSPKVRAKFLEANYAQRIWDPMIPR